MLIARLSKAKSTTHDFAQAIMKKPLKQKINYPISQLVRSVGCRYSVLLNLPRTIFVIFWAYSVHYNIMS